MNADNDLDSHKRRALARMSERGESDPTIISEGDGHRSAYSDKQRPGYREVESLLEADRISTLYINDRARIWRNDIEYLMFLINAKKHDTDVVPVIEAPIGNIDDPMVRLIEFINGWKNEQYRNAVSNTLRATKQDFRNAGLYVGNRPRFGLSLVGKKFERKIVTNDDFACVLEILSLYLAGKGAGAIALTLSQRGRTWAYSKTRRAPMLAESVLGLINHIEQYQPFLDPLLYEQVLARRQKRRGRKSNGRRTTHPPLFLSMLLYCQGCKSRFYVNHHRDYSSYLHPGHVVCSNPRRWVKSLLVDGQVWDQLAQMQEYFQAHATEAKTLMDMESDSESEILDYEHARERLTNELLTLRRNYNRGDFGDSDERAVLAYFQTEQTRILRELNALVAPVPTPPRQHMTRDALIRMMSAPIAELRKAAVHDPAAAKDWVSSIVERVEIWDTTAKVYLFGDISTGSTG